MNDFAIQIAKQDTHSALSIEQQRILMSDAGNGKTWCVELSAVTSNPPTNAWVKIYQLDAAGNPVPAAGQITIDLQSLVNLGVTNNLQNRAAAFRIFKWKDATTCALWQAAVLMTVPEQTP